MIQDLVHCWRLALHNLLLSLPWFRSFRASSRSLLLWLHRRDFILLIASISIICLCDSLWCSLTYLVIIIILLSLILIPLSRWISQCVLHSNLFVFLFNRLLAIRLTVLVRLILLWLSRLQAWVRIWRSRCTHLLFWYLLFLFRRALITIILSISWSTAIRISIQ